MPNKWPLVIELPIRPIGKARPRFTRSGNAYTPDTTKKFEQALGWSAKAAMGSTKPLSGPIHVSITAKFKHYKGIGLHIIKPDADNIIKSCLDSLNSIVYLDDSQVCSLVIKKLTAGSDSLRIEIVPLTPNLELAVGFEPTTHSSQNRCSAAELRQPVT
jgi:Holliday junction resolvase RusA-like endonuclease